MVRSIARIGARPGRHAGVSPSFSPKPTLACRFRIMTCMSLSSASGLPEPVQRALNVVDSSATVKKVSVRNLAGETVYEIELERNNAANPRLLVAADGTILSDSRQQPADALSASAAVYSDFVAPVLSREIKPAELPEEVRETFEKEGEGREIAHINAGRWDGRAAYRIEFREQGRNSRFYVAEDGTVLRPKEKPPASPIGTKFADTPAAVQQTIRREAGDGEIIKIHRAGLVAEPTTYTIDIRRAGGIFQLSVAQDGSVRRDSRQDAAKPKGK